MWVEYTTDQTPGALFRAELPAGVLTPAGAVLCAEFFAREAVGSGLADNVICVVCDDNGEELTRFRATVEADAALPTIEPLGDLPDFGD